jgi:SAM-dependent methyltransferase
MSDPIIFDRTQVRRQRDRAAVSLADHDFLLQESADRLCDRLEDVARGFPRALDIGCHGGELSQRLAGRFGIETLVSCDLSPKMAALAATNGALTVAADEETLPFAEGRFDLVVSNLSLHWVNDLPGALLQIRRILKPDGLFIASLLGGETLKEWRQAMMEAELAEEDGVSPRVSPFVDVRDAGGLMQRAGFALPVADIDPVNVTYGNPMTLLADLRGMGEGNAVKTRRKGFTRRGTFARALSLYQERFADHEGRLPASFQILTMTGWTPAGK